MEGKKCELSEVYVVFLDLCINLGTGYCMTRLVIFYLSGDVSEGCGGKSWMLFHPLFSDTWAEFGRIV